MESNFRKSCDARDSRKPRVLLPRRRYVAKPSGVRTKYNMYAISLRTSSESVRTQIFFLLFLILAMQRAIVSARSEWASSCETV